MSPTEDEQYALNWLNSLVTIPSALLTSSLEELSDGQVFVDLLRELQIKWHHVSPHTALEDIDDVPSGLQWLSDTYGYTLLPPELTHFDSTNLIRQKHIPLILSFLLYIKQRYDEVELLIGKHTYTTQSYPSSSTSPSSASPSPLRPFLSISSRLSPTRNQPLHSLFLQNTLASTASPSLSTSYTSPPQKSSMRPQIRPLTINNHTDNAPSQVSQGEKKKDTANGYKSATAKNTKTITKTVTIPLSSFTSTLNNNTNHHGPYEYDPSASYNSHHGWLGAGMEIPGLLPASPPSISSQEVPIKGTTNTAKNNTQRNTTGTNDPTANTKSVTLATTVPPSVPILSAPPVPSSRTNPTLSHDSTSSSSSSSQTTTTDHQVRPLVYYDKSDTGSVISEASLAPSLSRLRAAAESKLGVTKSTNATVPPSLPQSSLSSSHAPPITYPSVIPRSRSSSVQRGIDKSSSAGWNASTEVPHGPGIIGSAANKDRQRELSAVHIRPMDVLQISPTRVVRATILEQSKAEGKKDTNNTSTNAKHTAPIPLSSLPLPPSISRPGLRLGTLVDPKYIPRFAVPTVPTTGKDNKPNANSASNSRGVSRDPSPLPGHSSTTDPVPTDNFYIPPVIFPSSPSKNPPSSPLPSGSAVPGRTATNTIIHTSPEDYFFALCTPKQKGILKWIRSLNIEIVPEKRFIYSTVIEKEFDNEYDLQKEQEEFLATNTPPSILRNEDNPSVPLILPFFPKRLPHLLWDGVLLHELVCACEARSGRKVPTMQVRIPSSTGPDLMNWNTNASVAPTSVINGRGSSVASKLPSSAVSVSMMSQKSSHSSSFPTSGSNHHITVLAGTKIPRDGTLSLGAANKNMELVFELLRQRPKVNHRYLWATDELLLGIHYDIAWGLLEDLMKAYGGVTRTITPTKNKKEDSKTEMVPSQQAFLNQGGGGSGEAPTNDGIKPKIDSVSKNTNISSSSTGVHLSQAQKLSKNQLRGIAEGTGSTPLVPNNHASSSSVVPPTTNQLPSNASVTGSVTDTVPLTTNDLGTENASNYPGTSTNTNINNVSSLSSHLAIDQIIYDGIAAKYILPAGNWNYLRKNMSHASGSNGTVPVTTNPSSSAPASGTTKPKRYLPLIPNPLAVPPVLLPLLPATAAGMGISTRAFSQLHRQHTQQLQQEQTLSTEPIDPTRLGFGKILPIQIDEVHNWLRTLELGNIAPLNDAGISHVLDHELFNGTILAAIAMILESELDPLGVHSGYKYYKKPKSFAEARANIEAALRMFRSSKWHLEPPPPLYIPQDRVHLHAPHPHHEHHSHHHHAASHAHVHPVSPDVLAGNAPSASPTLGYGTNPHEPPQRLRSNSITSMVSQRTNRTHRSHRSHKHHTKHPQGYTLVAAPSIPDLYLYCTEEILVANRDAMYGLLWYICRFYGHIDAVQQAAQEMEEVRLKMEQEQALAQQQEEDEKAHQKLNHGHSKNHHPAGKHVSHTENKGTEHGKPPVALTILPPTNCIPILLGTSSPRATSPLPTYKNKNNTDNNEGTTESSHQLLSPGRKFNRNEAEIMLWLSTLGIYDALGLDPKESDIVIKELENECADKNTNNLNSSFVSFTESSDPPSEKNTGSSRSNGNNPIASPSRNTTDNASHHTTAILRRRYCTVKCTIGPLCDGTLLSDLLRIFLPDTNPLKTKLLVTIEPNPHTPTVAKMNLQKCIDIIRQHLSGFSLRYITDDHIVDDIYHGQPEIVIGFLHDCMVYAKQNHIQGKFQFGSATEIEALRAEQLAAEAAAAAAAAAAKAAAKRRLSYTSTVTTSTRRDRDPLSLLNLAEEQDSAEDKTKLSMNINDYASMVINQLSGNNNQGNTNTGTMNLDTLINPVEEEVDAKISGTVLVQWLRSLDIVLERPQDLELGNEGNQSAPEWNNGILLCQLVNVCETMKGLHRNPVLGLDKHPKTGAAKLANIRKALEILRLNPSMALDHLWSENPIRNGDAIIIRTLLAQIRRAYGHHLFSHFHDLHPKAEEHLKSPLRNYLVDKDGRRSGGTNGPNGASEDT